MKAVLNSGAHLMTVPRAGPAGLHAGGPENKKMKNKPTELHTAYHG